MPIEFSFVIEKIILIVIVMSVTMVVAMYTTFMERKVAAVLQDRRGPNRAGPFGLLQPLADGLKLFFKEEIIPTKAHKKLFILGPVLAIVIALMTSAIIPWTSHLTFNNLSIPVQVTDVNIGILYIFGVVSLGVYGIMIGAWASNNKFSLLGALRAASQIISYELPMGLSLIALLMITGTFSLQEIVSQQQSNTFWNVIYQPLGFIIFLVCSFAECNRTPFDLPESENELVGGYHAEYSSMKLGLYLFAEYINMFISSAVMATLFFGGYDIPFVNDAALSTNVAASLGLLSLFAKIFIFIFVFMWVRWTIPRFRYDQLMNLGWKGLIPLSILNMLITAVVSLYFK